MFALYAIPLLLSFDPASKFPANHPINKPEPRLTSTELQTNTKLIEAAEQGDKNRLIDLLEEEEYDSGRSMKAVLNTKRFTRVRKSGGTVLHFAAIGGNVPTVKALLKMGAGVNAVDDSNQTALHMATMKEHHEVVKLLMKRGAAIDVESDKGITPLHIAAFANLWDMVKLLISLGAEPERPSKNGGTPLHYAAAQGSYYAAEALIEAAPFTAVHRVSDTGETPLYSAAATGKFAMVKLFVEKGAELDVPSKEGGAALTVAVANSKRDIAEFLLAQGAALDIGDKHGSAPMHWAARNGDLEMLQKLEAKGASLTDPDNQNQAPIYEAANKNHSGIVEYLISRGVPVDVRNYQNVSVGHAAARGGYVEVLTMLLDAGMPLDAVDDNLGTMLFYACASSRPGTARVLVERGVSVDQPVRNGMTPLIANTLGQGGSYEVIDLLTAHGANASAVEARGCAPLHFAASRGTPALVELLVSRGANVHAKDGRGLSVLHSAALDGKLDVVEWLLANTDIDVDVGDEDDNSALEWLLDDDHRGMHRDIAGVIDLTSWLKRNKLERAIYFPLLTALNVSNTTEQGGWSALEALDASGFFATAAGAAAPSTRPQQVALYRAMHPDRDEPPESPQGIAGKASTEATAEEQVYLTGSATPAGVHTGQKGLLGQVKEAIQKVVPGKKKKSKKKDEL